MSAYLELAYVHRLGNHVDIFILCVVVFIKRSFWHMILSNTNNLGLFGTLTSTTTLVRVDLGVIAAKGSQELEPHHQMQFNVLTRASLWGGVLFIRRGYSELILSPAYRTICDFIIFKEKMCFINNKNMYTVHILGFVRFCFVLRHINHCRPFLYI